MAKRLTAKFYQMKKFLQQSLKLLRSEQVSQSLIPADAPKLEGLPEYSLTYTDETRVEKINYTIREEETEELIQGARQIATPGVEGERTIKTRVYSSTVRKSTAKNCQMRKPWSGNASCQSWNG